METVIIDGVGSNHYVDKCNGEQGVVRECTDEVTFIRALHDVLAMGKVCAYVSKSALFDEEKLRVDWPFQNAGVPRSPAEVMPAGWRQVVTHSVLVYRVDVEAEGDGGGGSNRSSGERAVTRRGLVVIGYDAAPRGGRKAVVCAASILRISADDVACEESNTFVG